MQAAPWRDIVLGLMAAILLQVLLALPFLLQHPAQYFGKAFEFSRVFVLQWSVNWSFIPSSIFTSKAFAVCLLAGHICLLLLFAQYRWCKAEGGLHQLLVHRVASKTSSTAMVRKSAKSSVIYTQRMLLTVFTGNLIGITFARTLHFQFYSWYFHTLPFLLWQAGTKTPLSLLILFCIEVCWNRFPPSTASSILLFVCHCAMIVGLWHSRRWLMQSKSE